LKKGRIWAAIPGRNPAALVAGGEGKVGEKLEDTELYQLVGLDGVGAAGFEVAGDGGLCSGGGAPMWEERRGPTGEHQWRSGKLSGVLVAAAERGAPR
jgi:hypothetical protein